MVLREETDSQSIVDKPVSIKRLEFSRHGFDQGGLSATIGSDETNSGFQVNIDVDTTQDWVI